MADEVELPITAGSVIWHNDHPWVLDSLGQHSPGSVVPQSDRYWVGVHHMPRGCGWIYHSDMERRGFVVIFDHPVVDTP